MQAYCMKGRESREIQDPKQVPLKEREASHSVIVSHLQRLLS